MPEPRDVAAITQGREDGRHGTWARVPLMTPSSHGWRTAAITGFPDAVPGLVLLSSVRSANGNPRCYSRSCLMCRLPGSLSSQPAFGSGSSCGGFVFYERHASRSWYHA